MRAGLPLLGLLLLVATPAARQNPTAQAPQPRTGTGLLLGRVVEADSTRPLSELAGIELPFERQRRVAAVATVMGLDSFGNAWRLRLVSAHLDATASIRRLWVFAAAIRARQAAHLAGVLAGDDVPTVIGVDLNSWAGGTSEPAYRTFRDSFPQTPPPGAEFTFRGGTLDYVFLRLPPQWSGRFGVVDGFFGSDHRPLIGRIDLMPGSASTSSSSSPFQWRRSTA